MTNCTKARRTGKCRAHYPGCDKSCPFDEREATDKKLFLVSRIDKVDYDEYDAFVVCCFTKKDALNIDPKGEPIHWKVDQCDSYWAAHPELVKITKLGTADAKTPLGVVLASFNAG